MTQIEIIDNEFELAKQDEAAFEWHVQKYNSSIQKTAENILELANVIKDAKTGLSDADFKKFRAAIGADEKKDSYIKKLLCIANASARLKPISDQLPPNYTTIYALAKMPTNDFQELRDIDAISPKMIASTLNILRPKPSKTRVNANELVLNFPSSSPHSCKVYLQIIALCKKHKIDITKDTTHLNQMPTIMNPQHTTRIPLSQ